MGRQAAPSAGRDVRYRFLGRTMPDPQERPKAELTVSAPVDGVATIRLYDVIDSYGGFWGISAMEVAEALDGLGADVTEIRLHVNSPGGEIFEGIAIKNVLRAHPAKVVAVVDGLAASAASFIAVSMDETVMGENTQLMVHDGWGVCIGPAQDMRKTADLLDHLSDNIAAMYAAKAGGSREDWRAAMLEETWYSAEEAVEAGLADRVDGGQADPAPQDGFDLSVFRYAGREAAPGPKAKRPAPAAAPPPPPVPAPAAGMTDAERQAKLRALRERKLAGRRAA